MSGGSRRMAARSRCAGVAACAARRWRSARRQRDAGQRRAQVALDVVVERLQRRDVQHPGAALRRRSRGQPSRAQRNAASVLPEPVGASSSVWLPAAIAGQPCAGRGWAFERALEPVANRWAEGREGVAAHTCNLLPGARDSVPGVWTAIRFVHVLSAIAWVGVQLTLFMLFPVLRRQLEAEQFRTVARTAGCGSGSWP